MSKAPACMEKRLVKGESTAFQSIGRSGRDSVHASHRLLVATRLRVPSCMRQARGNTSIWSSTNADAGADLGSKRPRATLAKQDTLHDWSLDLRHAAGAHRARCQTRGSLGIR